MRREYFQRFLIIALTFIFTAQIANISNSVASDLAVSLSASTENFTSPGQEIVFGITVQNTSPDSDINEISIVDNLTGFSQSGLTLALGDSQIFYVSYFITQGDLDSGIIEMEVTASGTDTYNVVHNASNSKSVLALQTSAMEVTLASVISSYNAVGNEIDYSIEVTNTGNVSLFDIELTTAGFTIQLGDLTIANLAPGASQTVFGKRIITLQDMNNGQHEAFVTASGKNPGNDIVVATSNSLLIPAVQNPQMSLNVVHSPQSYSTAGTNIEFTVTVVNTGNVTLSETVVNFSQGVVVVSGNTAIGNINPGSQIVIVAQRIVTQDDLNIGSFTLNTELTAKGPDNNVITQSNSLNVVATQSPQLTVSNIPSLSSYSTVGQNLDFVISVANSGNITLTGVTLVVPSGVVVASGNAGIGTLHPNSQAQITLRRVVTQADLNVGSYTLDALATGTAAGIGIVSGRKEASVVAIQSPSWIITQTPNKTTYSATGEVINFTINISNNGNVNISNATVSVPKATTGPILQSGDTNTNGIFDVGESWVYTHTYLVTLADLDNGSVEIIATANGTPSGGILQNAVDSDILTANKNTQLTVENVANPLLYSSVGQTINFSFTVRNTGNVSINSVLLSVPGITIPSGSANLGTITPGTFRQVNGSYIITQTDLDAGNISVTATASGRDPGNQTVTASDIEVVEAVADAELSLGISAQPTSYNNAGQAIVFTMTLGNPGNVTINTVSVSVPGVIIDGGGNIGSIAPGGQRIVTGSRTITQADMDAGNFAANATVTGLGPGASNVTANNSITVNALQSPNFTLSIDPSQQTYNINNQITFTFNVVNTGNVVLSSMVITAPGVNITAGSENIGSLLPGATRTVTGSRVMTQADVDNGMFTATASVAGRRPDGSNIEKSESITITAILNSKLTVSVTSNPGSFDKTGELITFTATITNTGNTTLNSVVLAAPGLIFSPNTTNLGTINPGASRQVNGSYIITQTDLDAGSISFTATASGRDPVNQAVTASDLEVVAAVADARLSLGISAQQTSYNIVGQVIVFTMTVGNPGNVTINTVSVSVPGVIIDGGGNIGSIAPGGQRIVTGSRTITQADMDAGSFVANATVTGLGPGASNVTANNSITLNALQSPNFTLSIGASQQTYNINNQITFTFNVRNTGNVVLSSMVITAPGVNITAGSENIGSLLPGATRTVTGSRVMTQTDIDNGMFTALVSVAGKRPDASNIEISENISITAILNSKLTVSVTSNPGSFDRTGELITFTAIITNAGNTTLNSVVLAAPGLLFSPGSTNLGIIPPGASRRVAGTIITTQDDLNHGTISISSTASGRTMTGVNISGFATSSAQAIQIPGIEIENKLLSVNGNQTLRKYSLAGDVLIIEVLVKNTGNVSINNIVVEDNLSAGTFNIDRLDPDINRSVSISYLVTQGDVDNGSIMTDVVVSGTDPNNILRQATGMLSIEGILAPSLNVDISVVSVNGNAAVTKYTRPGDIVALGIQVTNNGNVSLQNISVVNELSGFNEIIDSLQPSNSANFGVTYLVTIEDVLNTQFNSTVTVSGYDPRNNIVKDVDSATVEANLISEISIQKTRVSINGNNSVERYSAVGDIILYSILVENIGNVPITNLRVLDPLIGINDSRSTFAPFEKIIYTATYTVNQNDINKGSVTNIAVARGVNREGGEMLFISTVKVDAFINAEIRLSKSANKPFFINSGDTIRYNLIVQNSGNVTLSNVVVEDPLTGFEEFIGTLLPGNSRGFITLYTIQNSDIINGVVKNVAEVSGRSPSGILVRDTSFVSVIYISEEVPDIHITKQSVPDGIAFAGENLTYNIDVKNTSGILSAKNITILDMLPSGLTFVEASHNGRFESGKVVWDVGNLAPLDSIRFILEVIVNSSVTEGTLISNKAVTQVQEITFSESNSNVVLVNTRANLIISKEVDKPAPEIGDEVLFTISVTNNGPSMAIGVSVKDRLPDGFTYLNHISQSSYNPITGIWQIGHMGVGDKQTLEIMAEVNPTGDYKNIAVLTAENFIAIGGNDSAYVEAKPQILLKIPEGFSPNNDGINDFFVIRGIESFPDNTLIVLNRWGNKVYEVAGYNNDWDGTNQIGTSLGGRDLPQGTYFYILDLGKPTPDGRRVFKGFVYLGR